MTLLPYVIFLFGLFLFVHDVLYHAGVIKLKIGKPFYIGKIRIYHAYVGLALIIISLLLM